ncbi:MAG: tetratricopeptide repeat protein [Steroidobacter sp.]
MRIAKMVVLALFAAVASGAVLAAPSGGSGGGSFEGPQREMTPEERAKAAYNRGVRAVKQAGKYEKTAAEAANEGKQTKALNRALSQHRKAREYFAATVRELPQMHEAWNYLGYTSRKLGEYDVALAAYDEALRLNPAFAEAIEYRGEAYLALNRIEDAKNAYMNLFRDARSFADQLISAMQQWVTERRGDPGALSSADIDAFAHWIDERATVARQTASLAVGAEQTAWN